MEIKNILHWAITKRNIIIKDRDNLNNLLINTGKLSILNELIRIIEIEQKSSLLGTNGEI